jgi:hypothetical protein
MGDGGLTTWVIYDHPADFPEHFVVRPWTVAGGGRLEPGSARLCGTLEQARAALVNLGLYRMDRQPDDDPTVVEVWL